MNQEKPLQEKTSEKFFKKTNFLEKTSKISIYFLVFLFPIFFLPWTRNILDFNKQALLLFLVFLSLIFWLVSKLIKGRIEINNNFLNLAVFIFLTSSFLSVIFSLHKDGSFWGLPFSVSQSFVTLLGFVIFYFLVANIFKKDEIIFLFLIFFLSTFLANLLIFFQIFGKFVLPFDFAKNIYFNTIGNFAAVAIFNSVLIILTLPLLFFVKGFYKIILTIFILASLFIILIVNYKFAWFVLLLGIIILFVFGLVNLNKMTSQAFTTTMMFFLVISLFFSFFNIKVPGVPPLLVGNPIDHKVEFDILKKINFKELLVGSGPSTFIYKWSALKPVYFNQTIFWADRFEFGASEILDRIITTGIIGLLSLLFLIFIFLKNSFDYLIKKISQESEKIKISEGANWFLFLGITASFSGIILSLFLYPINNLSILLLFWLLIACLVIFQTEGFSEKKESFFGKKVLEFISSPKKNLITAFVFVIIIISAVGFIFSYFQKYAGEVRYYQALKNFQKGQLDSSINYLEKAINLNSKMDIYQRDISQLYLFKINEILNRQDLDQNEKIIQSHQAVSLAVGYANQATNLNKNEATNWTVRAFVYQNLIGFLQKSEDWAINSYEKARELEPSNPYILTEIGKIYLSKADMAEQQGNSLAKEENIRLANDYFEKAIALKPDYPAANYQRAMSYIREGKIQEATEKLEGLKILFPRDIGLAFQLGLIYYNNNKIEMAKNEFLRAVAVNPDYSNARYFLGLIYEKEGNKKEAISQFEIIEKFNPENQEVKKILTNLREGKPPLEGIISSQPPIPEKTPETLEGKK